MVMDPFTATLADFRQWADSTQRKLAGDPGVDAGELLTLFDLMRDEQGIARPGDLGEGDLEELLLEVYPREVFAIDRADLEDTVPAVRDLLVYLTERGEMPEATARALERELAQIEPRFADTVLDSSDWELVDGEELDLDLKEAFGLPDQLSPMRLPPAAELAAAAGRAPLIGQLLALAAWVGKAAAGRPVNDDAELGKGDTADAAAALGISVQDLDYLRWLALDTGFIDLDEDETHVLPGEEARAWHDGDDDERLEIWETVFAFVLDALEVVATLDPARSEDLDLSGHGTALAVMLFLARAQGIAIQEASEVIRGIAVGDLAPDRAVKKWRSWVRAHSDPARLLADRMAQAGAVQVSDGEEGELARLTPLGLAAMRNQLTRYGVEIPLLGSPEEMTAADLIAAVDGVSEEEFEAESAAWLAHRTPESAARDLLSVAAESDPAARMLAVVLVTEIGAPAEPAWRDAMSRPELRGYAKNALMTLADVDAAGDVPPDLEPDEDDLARVIIDMLVTEGWTDEDAEHDPAELRALLSQAIPPGRETAAFEMMARVPHPDAAGALTAIGRHHPDKKVAKLARKCAYKAASRQSSQRR